MFLRLEGIYADSLDKLPDLWTAKVRLDEYFPQRGNYKESKGG